MGSLRTFFFGPPKDVHDAQRSTQSRSSRCSRGSASARTGSPRRRTAPTRRSGRSCGGATTRPRGRSRARDGAHRLHHLLRLHAHHRALPVGRRRLRRRDQAPRPALRRRERQRAPRRLRAHHHRLDRVGRRRDLQPDPAQLVRADRGLDAARAHRVRAARGRHAPSRRPGRGSTRCSARRS